MTDSDQLAKDMALLDEPEDQLPAVSGELLSEQEKSVLNEMQELVDRHEQEGLNTIENRELRLVLNEVRAIGLSNLIDMFEVNADGSFQVKRLTEIPREVMAGVKSIKVKRDRLDGDITETIEFVMHDKLGALDKLLRYHGAYAVDNSQKQSGSDKMLDMIVGYVGSQGLPKIEDNSA